MTNQSSSSSSPPPRAASIGTLRESINRKYRRSDSAPWSYLEESMLAEIARRPDALSEMKELWDYQEAMPMDRKRFFPHTVGALLEKWTGTLDVARADLPENRTLRSKSATEDDRHLQRTLKQLDRIAKRPK